MKKEYIVPSLQVNIAQVANMVAVSLIDNGKADPNAEVLVKSDDSWNIWDDDAGEL